MFPLSAVIFTLEERNNDISTNLFLFSFLDCYVPFAVTGRVLEPILALYGKRHPPE